MNLLKVRFIYQIIKMKEKSFEWGEKYSNENK